MTSREKILEMITSRVKFMANNAHTSEARIYFDMIDVEIREQLSHLLKNGSILNSCAITGYIQYYREELEKHYDLSFGDLAIEVYQARIEGCPE